MVSTLIVAAVNRYKYSCKALETRDGINMYLYPFRQLMADVSLWSTPDPMAVLASSASQYNAIGGNPIKYVDPMGLYKNRKDAEIASRLYGGASIHYALDRSEYYIALNDTRTWKYTSGGTLTRYFGDPFFGIDALYTDELNSGIGGGSATNSDTIKQLPTWASALNTTATVLGVSNSVKGEIINYAIPKNEQTGTLARYMKITKNAGRFCSYANASYSILKMVYYYKNGGKNELVYIKYSYDVVNSLAPNWFAGTPAYIWVSMGSLTYTVADALTDGFWINDSILSN